jgi:hypothetical protein
MIVYLIFVYEFLLVRADLNAAVQGECHALVAAKETLLRRLASADDEFHLNTPRLLLPNDHAHRPAHDKVGGTGTPLDAGPVQRLVRRL